MVVAFQRLFAVLAGLNVLVAILYAIYYANQRKKNNLMLFVGPTFFLYGLLFGVVIAISPTSLEGLIIWFFVTYGFLALSLLAVAGALLYRIIHNED